MTVRIMGKAAFAHIEDGSGRIQIYLKRDVVWAKRSTTSFFKQADRPGRLHRGHRPHVHDAHGRGHLRGARAGAAQQDAEPPARQVARRCKDVETRYRQRYVDLLANPEVREVFRTRARIVTAIRRYLDDNGFLEVETPILQPIYGGAAARPFTTHHNQLDQDLFLRISFELYLKRLLVGGFERVYEIGRDFRNEGISFKHNPEFTQLEFYEAYTDYNGMMRRIEEMLAAIAQEVTRRHSTITYQRPRDRPDARRGGASPCATRSARRPASTTRIIPTPPRSPRRCAPSAIAPSRSRAGAS